MPDAVKYILDANIFIEAKRRYYAFNLCPGFWDSLLHHNSMGNLESIDRVRNKELSEGDDLDAWSKKSPYLFASTDSKFVLADYGDIIQWVQSQERFTNAAKSEFSSGVDAWVIAYAKANNAIVVTHEVSAPKSRTDVKIPDVCNHFNIKCTNTFDMLQKLGIVFYWKTS
jgi:hypothetical protein